jgi:wobble nucleotide-excising tRNase
MAYKVTMDNVATYRSPTVLQSDKKITLLYGLNGTGKSTLSNYLYSPLDKKYSSCTRNGFDDAHLYVYNAKFVRDNFYEIDKLSGVFTLSKVNADIEEEIKQKTKLLADLGLKKKGVLDEITLKATKLSEKKAIAEDSIWEIKKQYSGGDRVLEYCLKGLMKSKESLFDYVSSLPVPLQIPSKTIEKLKAEVAVLQGQQAKEYPLLGKVIWHGGEIEKDQIFQQIILGNQDTPVAGLIKNLDNGDWVSQGIPFVDLLQSQGDDRCPFCQAKTLSTGVVKSIKDYFDLTFDTSLKTLKGLQSKYKTYTDAQIVFDIYDENPFFTDRKVEFDALYKAVAGIWAANQEIIERKVKGPSVAVTLKDSEEVVASLNILIDSINEKVNEHNAKIKNKEAALEAIKKQFWEICRWDQDKAIKAYKAELESHQTENKEDQKNLTNLTQEETDTSSKLAELQKKTVNIEEAIGVINSRLIDLGIDAFHIIKAEENRYRVSRNGVVGEDFLSLSEGEKTVISFLYFVELCKGKRTATQVGEKKIVVIDDPISSLSHLYIFNIGEMIKAEFSSSDRFEHVIVMTHSLYFFYELTETNHDNRKNRQDLRRIVKNSTGSKIVEMKYEEVQNDYQAYWNVIMDKEQHPALIANCMRNIIEYFFNFVKRMPLSNIFQQTKFKDPKHLAFYRFMNRESHSLGQNIFDHKEFDYDRFRESFKLVFDDAGFSEHYAAMSKVR